MNSNYKSVHLAAKELTSDDCSRFALISDLTSFVQVGDLLIMDPDKGFIIAEVKQGAVNERIFDFLRSYSQTKCDRAAAYFVKEGGKKAVDQLGRMMRQQQRMAHVVEVASTGDSVDPDSGQRIVVLDEALVPESWDGALAEVLENSKQRGWAIEVVDNCLFIGAYRDQFRAVGQYIFKAWLETVSEDEQKKFPSTNLLHCMINPLALPVFSRHLPVDHMFDIAFGRAVVWVGLQADAFIELCNQTGLPARWSTRKEAAKYLRKGGGPWLLDHRAVLTGEGQAQGTIAEGTFVRLFFHGETPLTIIEVLRRNTNLATTLGDPATSAE